MNQPCVSRSYIFQLVAGLGFMALTLTLTGAAADTVFKCQGADGAMHYQGAKCEQGEEISHRSMKLALASAPTKKADAYTLSVHSGAHNSYRTAGSINNVAVTMIVDTGASSVTVPANLAIQIGIKCERSIPLLTAAGLVASCTSTVKTLKIGKFEFSGIAAVITPTGSEILLGQSVLSLLKMEQANGIIRLSAL